MELAFSRRVRTEIELDRCRRGGRKTHELCVRITFLMSFCDPCRPNHVSEDRLLEWSARSLRKTRSNESPKNRLTCPPAVAWLATFPVKPGISVQFDLTASTCYHKNSPSEARPPPTLQVHHVRLIYGVRYARILRAFNVSVVYFTA